MGHSHHLWFLVTVPESGPSGKLQFRLIFPYHVPQYRPGGLSASKQSRWISGVVLPVGTGLMAAGPQSLLNNLLDHYKYR